MPFIVLAGCALLAAAAAIIVAAVKLIRYAAGQRRMGRQIHEALTAKPGGPVEYAPVREVPTGPDDCPWCSEGWKAVSGIGPQDCSCDEDCGGAECRMLAIKKES